MAVQKPLVLIDGKMQQLPVADTLEGGLIGRNIEFRNIVAPAAAESEQDGWPVFEFPNGQTKEVVTSALIPPNFDDSFVPSATIQYCPMTSGMGNGNLDLFMEFAYRDTGDNTSGGADETPAGIFTSFPSQVIDVVGQIHKITWNLDPSLFIPGGRLKGCLIRNGGAAGDTYDEKIGIFTSVFIIFKVL